MAQQGKPRVKPGRKPQPAPGEAVLARVRQRFVDAGVTIRGWAKAQGFHYSTVIDVMNGRRAGHHGEAHRVAVALGLKHGLVTDAASFDPREVPNPPSKAPA